MTGSPPEAAAHLQVAWVNAISTRGGVSCCYEDPPTALRDAWNLGLERNLWNNTTVSVRWHLSHEATRHREAEWAAHPRWGWSCECGPAPFPCRLSARHREEERSEYAAAIAATGLSPMPGEQTLLARLPPYPGTGPSWEPGPKILAMPRRGVILLSARHLDAQSMAIFTDMLASGLDGRVTTRNEALPQPQAGPRPALAGPLEFPEPVQPATPAAAAQGAQVRPVGRGIPRRGKAPGA